MTRPIVFVAGLFALGICIGKIIPCHFILVWLVTCILVLLSVLTFKKDILSNIFASLSILSLGCSFYANIQTHNHSHIKNFVKGSPQRAVLRGVIISDPEARKTDYGGQKLLFILSAERLKIEGLWHSVSGKVKVSIFGVARGEPRQRRDETLSYRYGNEVALEGIISLPKPATNPGQFDYRQYLYEQNIYATFKVKSNDGHILIAERGTPVLKFCYRIRAKLKRLLEEYLTEDGWGLMYAILLGERSGIEQDLKEYFIKTGTVHILAISGLHIGIVAFILCTVFNALRIPRKATLLLTIIILVIYAALTGANAPVMRSTIMISVFFAGILINREADILNSLGLAALLILLVKPNQIFEPGFQLSFLSVGSIIYLMPRINPLLKRLGLNRYLSNAVSMSISAWLGILPLVSYYFNIVSPIALIANLIVVPLLGIVIASGISLLIVCFILKPCLCIIFANTTSFLTLSLTKLASLFSFIPFAYFRVPKPSMFTICAYYALLLVVFEYRRLRLSKARLLIILIGAINIFLLAGIFAKIDNRLKVTFLDVGHGDCIFIEFPRKGTILIDGGRRDIGRNVIAPFLWNKGIRRIDIVVATHPEADHIAGLLYVLDNFDVGLCIDNGMYDNTGLFIEYLKTVKKKAIPRFISRGEHIIKGIPGCKIELLHPPKGLLRNTESDFNNNSIVLKLTVRDRALLMCGDIEEEGLRSLLGKKDALKADIIKVPHHGSALNEIGRLFFNIVRPKIAVISVEDDDRFNLPHTSTINALKDSGAIVYATADYGAIEIDF